MLSIEEIKTLVQCDYRGRNQVSGADIDAFIAGKLEEIEMCIRDIRLALYLNGLLATDLLYATAKESLFSNEQTFLMPRVRLDARYGTPSFQWERIHRNLRSITGQTTVKSSTGAGRSYIGYVKRKNQKSHERMKIVLTSESLRINKQTQRVPDDVFMEEPDWAKTLATLVEDKLAKFRRFNSSLSDISRKVFQLKASKE